MLDQTQTACFAAGRRLRPHLRKRKERHQICVAVEGFVRNPLKIRFCVKKIITEHDAAEPFYGVRELLVVVVLFFFALNFEPHRRTRRLALLLLLVKAGRKILQRKRRVFRLAERNIECHHAGTVFAQRIEQMCKINSRKGPMPQRFL